MTKSAGGSRSRAGVRTAGWAKAAAPPAELPAGLPARLVAAAALADILCAGHGLDEAFAGEVTAAKVAALDDRDRLLARSIVVVSLRHLGSLRRRIALLLERGMPKKSGNLEWVLLTTAAQILHMDVPDHAAVNLCVLAVRQDPNGQAFAALANAVARNIARQSGETIEFDALVDTPAWLATRWRQTFGDAKTARIATAHGHGAALDISVKADAAGWAEKLGGLMLPTGSIRLATTTPVPQLPGFGDGEWWVQDAAAALPVRLLRVQPGQAVADLCAAPGGKTAQLIAAGAQVTAVDRSAERLKRLTANLERLGLVADTKVADVTSFTAAPFDAVLLDAPCTATGTIRRHPDVAWTKRGSDIASLSAIQARMLDRALTLLKPGGTLVYCVCSLEPEEGDAQIASLLRRNPDVARDPIAADEVGGLADAVTAAGDLRTLPFMAFGENPAMVGMDGFFAARLRRKG